MIAEQKRTPDSVEIEKPLNYADWWTGHKELDERLVGLEQYNIQFRDNKTYPADCRKIAAVDSHNSIGIERKENINKNRYLYKNILKCNLFSRRFVVEHTPVSHWELQGLVSIPISIIDST